MNYILNFLILNVPIGASDSPQIVQKAGKSRHVGGIAFLTVFLVVEVLEYTNL